MSEDDESKYSESEMALRVAEDAALRAKHDVALAKLKERQTLRRELEKLKELREAERREADSEEADDTTPETASPPVGAPVDSDAADGEMTTDATPPKQLEDDVAGDAAADADPKPSAREPAPISQAAASPPDSETTTVVAADEQPAPGQISPTGKIILAALAVVGVITVALILAQRPADAPSPAGSVVATGRTASASSPAPSPATAGASEAPPAPSTALLSSAGQGGMHTSEPSKKPAPPSASFGASSAAKPRSEKKKSSVPVPIEND